MEDGFLLLRELMQMFTKLVLPMFILLAVLGIWEAGVYIRNTPHFILPPPSKLW